MKENKQPRIKILVACHKEDPNIRQDEIYMPIQVGKALHPELDLGFQCDNTGENISDKNGSYCELTALYWAWKNLKDTDYIGLCHYRRYYALSNTKIIKNLEKHNGITVKPKTLPTSIFNELCLWTSLEDTTIFLDTIITLYPDYTKDVITYYFINNKFSQCNMFILSQNMFDDYCNFLFSIIDKTTERINKSNYTRQQRVNGYLAETLLGLWLLHNKINLKKTDIDNNNKQNIIKTKIIQTINNFRYNLSFWLNCVPHKPKDIYVVPSVLVGLQQDGIKLKKDL